MSEEDDKFHVTNADRAAAWDYNSFHCLPDRQMKERWLSGYYDDQPAGRAINSFASHRIATTKSAQERIKALEDALQMLLDSIAGSANISPCTAFDASHAALEKP